MTPTKLSGLGTHPQDEVVTVLGHHVCIYHQEHLQKPERKGAHRPGPALGRPSKATVRESQGRGRKTRRPPHAHTNGHEVGQDDQVPQVVKAVVAEEELGALQKRRLVLGPGRVLARECTLRNGGPAGGHGRRETDKACATRPTAIMGVGASPPPPSISVYPARGKRRKYRSCFIHKDVHHGRSSLPQDRSRGHPGTTEAVRKPRWKMTVTLSLRKALPAT